MKRPIDGPTAVVLGDIDMLRPLVLAGIPTAVCAGPGALPRYSRYAKQVIEWFDPWKEPESLLDSLIKFASGCEHKPILYYESDADLLMISRNRKVLGNYYRFVLPEEQLTESLVDKLRFHELAEKLDLPVPRTALISASEDLSSGVFDLRFPLIVKPLTRNNSKWSPVAGLGKAVRIETPEALKAMKKKLDEMQIEFLAQELIPGDESSIESYHVYVDEEGRTAGEFTGKKIRTFPKEFGQSCALTITDAADVRDLGRDLTARLKFRGLAKFDFKRDPEGHLHLLEVNPRFSLWHHLGAVAGVNLPLLVYCDLAGIPRPKAGRPKAGTRWCRVWQDISTARADGMSFTKWLKWAWACEAKAGLSWDDPFPIFRAGLRRSVEKIASSTFRRNGSN